MIKVIKCGDEAVFYQKCRKCHTIFSYQACDVVTHLVPRENMSFPAFLFSNEDGQVEISEIGCPHCKNKMQPQYETRGEFYCCGEREVHG